ncbi:TldD/PmbA family protein [Thalassobaculum sp. OXR-137]|uniref:TldD/PmbA family protein n=1 Tax=Thalassobaculum sp. OXR-137 TaxID=3100173 RepID=UPI002AC928DC|nr:TldD/PmbA family protein [Thalassobaculum sp. OXR-137]WPZ35609.1 TldD/PmbA family protein [Thalassobaculum sp. OXR-137]
MTDLSPHDLLDDLLTRAKRAGADAADAIFAQGVSQSVSQRLGKPEAVERSEGKDLGLRVFVGQRQAVVSTTDLKGDALDDMIERAIAMARVAPEDPYAGLADPAQIAKDWPQIEMFDPTEPSADTLVERARMAEDAARAVAGVTNSEGAEAGFGVTDVTLAATNGFTGAYKRSSYSLSVSVIAGTGQKMERDYDYSAKVFDADLDDPEEVGRRAGERAVRRLNPRRPKTCRVPVIMEPRAARSMLGYLASAISGSAIARGTSFLKDSMGAQLFRPEIQIHDDPHRPRGFRSKPFDAEGLATRPRAVIDNGRLTSWTLDLATARQLGLESTASASRSTGGTPGPSVSNLYLAAGTVSPEDMIKDIESGFLVTEMMGTSVNLVTGDYSRGAAGYWIENGEITFPVSEMTIGGHLKEMFASLLPADDLEFKYGMDSPTIRIEGLLVGGGEG